MSSAKMGNRVEDIYGHQVKVNGRWFHAELIFGRPASEYSLGQLVEEFSKESASAAPDKASSGLKPDEFVSCALYRGCSSNEMTDAKTAEFAQVMVNAGGWGQFPMIAGYVEVLHANDVEQCETLVAEGREHVWLLELGWSRLVSSADIGARYVHIDNGHHRMAAAAFASDRVGPILVPVADLRLEESSARFVAIRP